MPNVAHQQKQPGFTLIELMMGVAIIGLLAAIAIPSYRQHSVRANRTAAQTEMMEIDNRQQQFLLSNRSYVDKTALEGSGYCLPGDPAKTNCPGTVGKNYSYAITLGAGTVPYYMVTFTPRSTGSQTSDGTLTLDSNGAKTPLDKW